MKGNFARVFDIYGDRLYFTENVPISGGGTIVAIDLTRGRRLWASKLDGYWTNNPQSGTAIHYENQLILEAQNDRVLIFVRETDGH